MEEPFEQAARAILDARYLVALTGAGISVESGIAPFRGPGGLWTKYGEPDMNGYQRFLADPKRWWEERLSGEDLRGRPELRGFENAQPNPGHLALAELERMGLLRYLITQNVDNLHYAAGNQRVAEIHGNRTKLRCIQCGARFPREEFTLETLPPRCPACQGVVKSDTVMFGEPIPSDVLEVCRNEALQADCMLVVGTSAVVYPAAELPVITRMRGGTLIEVNPLESALTRECDIVVRGPSGELLPQLVEQVKALQR
ncbi:MAG: NAD-dependent deacylase [Chloroflexi bacterium]|nr:NAD-dependent deacylase [Chloroflexota bacterium]